MRTFCAARRSSNLSLPTRTPRRSCESASASSRRYALQAPSRAQTRRRCASACRACTRAPWLIKLLTLAQEDVAATIDLDTMGGCRGLFFVREYVILTRIMHALGAVVDSSYAGARLGDGDVVTLDFVKQARAVRACVACRRAAHDVGLPHAATDDARLQGGEDSAQAVRAPIALTPSILLLTCPVANFAATRLPSCCA